MHRYTPSEAGFWRCSRAILLLTSILKSKDKSRYALGGVCSVNSIKKFVKSKVAEIDWTVGMLGRLEQLRIMAQTEVPSDCLGNWHYPLKRNGFNKNRFMKRKIGRVCVVCGEKESLHRHHIIPLKNGGITIAENIVGVCSICHEEIHGYKFKK